MKLKHRTILLTLISIFVTVFCMAIHSYALWIKDRAATQTNTLEVGCFKIDFENLTSSIELNNTYPVSDEKGLRGTPYTFTITNRCSINDQYLITLNTFTTNQIPAGSVVVGQNADGSENRFFYETYNLKEKIKFAFSEEDLIPTESYLLSTYALEHLNSDTNELHIESLDESIILASGSLQENETRKYNLYLWFDQDAGNEIMGQTFKASINIIHRAVKNPAPVIVTGDIGQYREMVYSDSTYQDRTEEDFKRLYGDHDAHFEYANDGSIVLDENNMIPVFDRTLRDYGNGYSVYITVKGDIYQMPVPPTSYNSSGAVYDGWGPATIFAMSAEDVAASNRLSWFGFRNGYFQIYSYCNQTYGNADIDGEKQDVDGYRSVKIDDKYNNHILNIQITGEHLGETKVYFNGKLFLTFPSGDGNGIFTNATVGDLRTLRGLKFTGNFYDVAVYNRVLSEKEIEQNWQYAKDTWNIED